MPLVVLLFFIIYKHFSTSYSGLVMNQIRSPNYVEALAPFSNIKRVQSPQGPRNWHPTS